MNILNIVTNFILVTLLLIQSSAAGRQSNVWSYVDGVPNYEDPLDLLKSRLNLWERGFCDTIARTDCFSEKSNYISMYNVLSRPRNINIQLRPNRHIGWCIILLLSGDISLNPGPDRCESCSVPVYRTRRQVRCEDCDALYHATCANITSKDYNNMIKQNQTWLCQVCKPEPCGMCDGLVTKDHYGMECDNCEKWVHASCGGVDDATYMEYTGKSCLWICPMCDIMNFSDSLFNNSSEWNTSNQFSLLEDQESEIDLSSTLESETSANLSQETTQPPVNKTRVGRKPSIKFKSAGGKSTTRDSLRIMLVNSQCLTNKVADLQFLIEEHQPDIIQATETWLTSKIDTAEIMPDAYDVFRKDRQKEIHGGILLACKKDLIMTRREEFETDCDIMWNQLELKGRHSLLIGTFYKPKHDDRSSVLGLEESLGKISSKEKGYNILLAGDFNQANIDWGSSTVKQKLLCIKGS